MKSLKPTEWLQKLNKTSLSYFPYDKFEKSCLIYSKSNYGIFLLEDKNGKRYTVKVKAYTYLVPPEENTALYVKHFASHIPNLLHVEDIYMGATPAYADLFKKPQRIDPTCKDGNLYTLFGHSGKFLYYLTKACYYNLGYFFGPKIKGELTYEAFVGFSFQLVVGLQTLHRLGVWHGDIKPANILVCNSEIAQKNRYIKYTYNDKISWTLSYDVLENRDFKIIDYGESKVLNDITEGCKSFKYEVNVAFYNIITLMWKKVINKQNINLYEDFIFRLKNCETDINDIMLEAPIFEKLKNLDVKNSYEVKLLPY
jgi:serine/threonine protein kinase